MDGYLHSVRWRTFSKLRAVALVPLPDTPFRKRAGNWRRLPENCCKMPSPVVSSVLSFVSSRGFKGVSERIRDLLTEPATFDYFVGRLNQGWRLAAIEWEREETVASARGPTQTNGEETPYGVKISSDCLHLEQDAGEVQVLMLILEEIVRDRRFSQIADELNRQGMRTRHGGKWTSAAVFDLLPRLIEIGPRLLKSKDWREKRPQVVRRTGASAG